MVVVMLLQLYIKFWNLQIVSPSEDVKRISFPRILFKKLRYFRSFMPLLLRQDSPRHLLIQSRKCVGDNGYWSLKILLPERRNWKKSVMKSIYFKGGFIQEFIEIVLYFGRFLKKRCKIAIFNLFEKIVYRSENFLRSNHLYDAYLLKK